MRRSGRWIGLVLLLGLAVLAALLLGRRGGPPGAALPPAPRPELLPLHGLYSLIRMGAAYLAAFLFAVVYGALAATHPRRGRVLLQVLDVLQSVPVLGFFPAAVVFFIHLLPGRFGMEAAAVFLIFTSQAWNMAFSVYETLSALPPEQKEAMEAFRVRGRLRLERFYLPACVPRLVYNSMLSWANGWYFLIACEIIATGRETRTLPGLGSFIALSMHAGSFPSMAAGIASLVLVIVVLHRTIWAPLEVWTERYKQEFAGARATMAGTAVSAEEEAAPLRERHRLAPALFLGLLRLTGALLGPFLGLRERLRGSRGREVLARAGAGAAAAASLLALLGVLSVAFRGLAGMTLSFPSEIGRIPGATLASFLRLLVAYLITVAWTLPAAVFISRSRRAHRLLVPLFQVLAAIPATAFFPVIVHFTVGRLGGMDLAAVLLVLTGMQWYLLFNVMGGIASIPADLLETAQAFNVRGRLFWRRLLLPAVLPSFVTGSIAAFGGGWNALILSEYVRYAGKTYSTYGLGAILNSATYDAHNPVLFFAALTGMLAAITALNRAVWRPLYLFATTRYKLEV